MTIESTEPQSELGSSPASGAGQSQGHRRRRRRRKNKINPASTPQAQQAQQAEQSPRSAPVAATPIERSRPHKPADARQASRPTQARKKKKAAPKNAVAATQPSNHFSTPPQAKGRGKARVARQFVGPMDHNYRIANGNLADGPPSTTQLANGGYSGIHQENSHAQPAIPVREDAPTRILCFIEDLFFLAKIQETARKLGVKVEFVKGDKDSVARITALPESERPALVVFDLNNLNAKPMTLIPKLKTKFKKATSIVGYLNHLQGDLKLKAIEVGCDTVMPKSAFSQSLPNLLRRYGLVEEEENTRQLV